MTAGPNVDSLRNWLQRLHTVAIEADALFDVCDKEGRLLISRMNDEEPATAAAKNSPRLLAAELLTFLLYAATLLEFFKASRSPEHYREAQEGGDLERLALARQAMAVHPRTAWETLSEISARTSADFPM
jgi:hypothetical protein